MARCYKCGSEKIVSSVSDNEGNFLGWICKKCYDEIPLIDKATKYLFGDEGFIDEERTVWDVSN